jgi:hypothetical protein
MIEAFCSLVCEVASSGQKSMDETLILSDAILSHRSNTSQLRRMLNWYSR